MSRSLVRSGIAASAVAALAFGVTAVPASANQVSEQVSAGSLVWYSQATLKASPRNDGTDSTIRLEVGGGVGVDAVTFSYSTDQGLTYNAIATVGSRNDNGAFAADWSSPFGSGATGVILRAQATVGATTVTALRSGVTVDTATGTNATVNLTAVDQVGYFAQPYATPQNNALVRVAGTTSATSGSVMIGRFDASGAPQSLQSATVTAPTGAATGSFATDYDLTGYTFGQGTDQVVLGAARDTDDVESFQLYQQAILGGTVTATADRGRVPSGQTATVTVTVLDSRGAPILGAQVRRAPSGSTAADAAVAYTDVNGRATFAQAGSATNSFYFANAADDSTFATPQDVRSADVSVVAYTPTPTVVSADSADGPAFDRDEFATGDVKVRVKDQEGQAITTARDVTYFWTITPFDGTAAVRVPSGAGVSTANVSNAGDANIPLPAGKSGTYELFAGLEAGGGAPAIGTSRVLTVKVGQAAIAFDNTSPEQTQAGTTKSVGGALLLEDRTPLAGRSVRGTFQRGTESGSTAGDAFLVVTGGGVNTLSTDVTTDATGRFAFQVRDPQESPQPTEIGGNLDAATVSNTFGNAGATKLNQGVDFLTSLTPATLVLAPETALGSGKTPGRPVSSTVVVRTADGTPLSNQSVTLTLDRGFFTPYAATLAALTPDPAATANTDAGSYRSLGQSVQVLTDATGTARFTAAIGRDVGFDDDGRVDATITASINGVSRTEQVDWTSANPVNGGTVTLAPAPAALQESGVLPKAPLDDVVAFDVAVTDQFGNKVGGETVAITTNKPTSPVSAPTVVSDFNVDSDVTASSTAVQDATVQATWVTETSRYNVATPAVATPGTETLVSTYAVSWYEVDFARSVFVLEHSGASSVPVGTVVPFTYTAKDQFGEPISDLFVQLFRSGPTDATDGNGDPVVSELLGQDGRIEYSFAGGAGGLARLSTVVRLDTQGGARLAVAEKSDSVTFVADAPVQASIKPGLGLSNRPNGNDRVVISVRKAVGARVTLYTIDNSEVAHKIRVGRVNAQGQAVFVIPDRRKKQVTRYGAIVDPTPTTLQGVTRKAGIR